MGIHGITGRHDLNEPCWQDRAFILDVTHTYIKKHVAFIHKDKCALDAMPLWVCFIVSNWIRMDRKRRKKQDIMALVPVERALVICHQSKLIRP